jgi:putative tryptophan/tyrosine transport system substrate-binding protein
MRRREFIAGLGAVATPSLVRAQLPAMAVIGYLDGRSPGPGPGGTAAEFRRSLEEVGYVDGRNVTIEYRWAESNDSLLPALAADLVRRRAAVIVASGGAPSAALAAKAATSTIPIVIMIGANPVNIGLADNLARPGGNVTGVTFRTGELGGKRVGLLHELVPKARTIAYLRGAGEIIDEQTPSILAAAHSLEQQVVTFVARSDSDLETAFATFVQRQAAALIVGAWPFLTDNSRKIVALAAHHKIPAIYPHRGFMFVGGLMSYSADEIDAYRQAAVYVGRILKGEKPADLPIVQAYKFRFVINQGTARSLGLIVPRALLALADEVVE